MQELLLEDTSEIRTPLCSALYRMFPVLKGLHNLEQSMVASLGPGSITHITNTSYMAITKYPLEKQLLIPAELGRIQTGDLQVKASVAH